MRMVLFFCLFFSLLQEAMAQMPPASAQWLSYLGMKKESSKVQELQKWLGNQTFQSGVDLGFDDKDILTKIDFFAKGNPYKRDAIAYPHDLPLQLSLTHTIFKVKEALGEPFKAEGTVADFYSLSKTLALNAQDGYTMTVEFSRGTLILISLNFLKNGAGASDDVGVEMKKTALRGESFYAMVNKNLYNRQFEMLMELMGKPEVDNRQKIVYFGQGLEIHKSQDKRITRMILYNDMEKNDLGQTFKTFPHLLPYGVLWSDNPSLVIDKLGQPVASSEQRFDYREGAVEMRLQFKGNRLSSITFLSVR